MPNGVGLVTPKYFQYLSWNHLYENHYWIKEATTVATVLSEWEESQESQDYFSKIQYCHEFTNGICLYLNFGLRVITLAYNPFLIPCIFDTMSYAITWWRHQVETFSALLAVCERNSPVTGVFPSQRLVTRSFDVFFDLRLKKRLSKHSWCWWFGTPSASLWRHRNDNSISGIILGMGWAMWEGVTSSHWLSPYTECPLHLL